MRLWLIYLGVIGMMCLFACSTEDEVPQKLEGRWKVKTIFVSGEDIYLPAIDSFEYFLRFNDNGTFVLNLDPNTCTAEFSAMTSERILIRNFNCSKICCENEAGEALKALMPKLVITNRTATILQLAVDSQFVEFESVP
jgi:hypothetical protein